MPKFVYFLKNSNQGSTNPIRVCSLIFNVATIVLPFLRSFQYEAYSLSLALTDKNPFNTY